MSAATKAATTAAVTALLAHIPCCLPQILLGVGSAASSGLTWLHRLDPYRPLLIGLSLCTMAYGFWQAYRPVTACACETHSAHDYAMERRVKIGVMWFVAVLVLFLNLIPHVD